VKVNRKFWSLSKFFPEVAQLRGHTTQFVWNVAQLFVIAARPMLLTPLRAITTKPSLFMDRNVLFPNNTQKGTCYLWWNISESRHVFPRRCATARSHKSLECQQLFRIAAQRLLLIPLRAITTKPIFSWIEMCSFPSTRKKLQNIGGYSSVENVS